jgi:porin
MGKATGQPNGRPFVRHPIALRGILTAGLVLVFVLLWGGSAWAQTANTPPSAAAGEQKTGDTKKPAASDSQPGASSKPAESGQNGTQQKNDDKSGEPAKSEGRAKSEDAAKPDSGIKLTLQEQSEVWADLVGGGKRGTSYNGLTTGILDVDLEQAFGWQRARFYASALEIHGHGPSRSLVGNQQLVSNLEATPSVKLYQLWLEQRVPGRISIRFGQEQVNDEFMVTAHGAAFLSSSFGTPGLEAADWPSGGPSYPLASPFVRLRWRASDQWSVLGAVYNADPAPPGLGDPQLRDRNGTAFRLDDHALAFGELRYTPDLDAPDNLQIGYKLGAWYHSGPFDDRRFDTAGGLLANPASFGIPRHHTGDLSVYGVIDQVLWRREDDKARGIGAFFRAQGAPADRNLADFSIEAGLTWSGPFDDRPKDITGIGVAYLGISPSARRFSQDLVAFGRAMTAYASNETVIEATYKAIVTDWLSLQPDAQFVLNPNAGIPGQFGPRPLPNAFIISLRATIKLGTL